jgi:hypothetical protein
MPSLRSKADAEAEGRARHRPWRMGAASCMAAKAPGRARRKDLNGPDRLASCMATTRRKRKPLGQRRVAQCERFNCFSGKQSRSDVIPDRKPVEVPIAPRPRFPSVPWRSDSEISKYVVDEVAAGRVKLENTQALEQALRDEADGRTIIMRDPGIRRNRRANVVGLKLVGV